MYFLGIDNGEFRLSGRGDYDNVLCQTADPQVLYDRMAELEVEHFNCSSSVDFPEEDGMPQATVDQFWQLLTDGREAIVPPEVKLDRIRVIAEGLDEDTSPERQIKRSLLAVLDS